MLPIFLASYTAVFAAEILGDKLLCTTGVLATRYRALPIIIGMAVAFQAKMAVAVLAGRAIAALPPLLVAFATTINFFAIAYALWRKPDNCEPPGDVPGSKAVIVSFAAIFFSEWADVGQITAATLAARFGNPFAVWLGAVTAMATKGVIAASVGATVRRWIQEHLSQKMMRYAAVGLLLILGALSAVETVTAKAEIPMLILTVAR